MKIKWIMRRCKLNVTKMLCVYKPLGIADCSFNHTLDFRTWPSIWVRARKVPAEAKAPLKKFPPLLALLLIQSSFSSSHTGAKRVIEREANGGKREKDRFTERGREREGREESYGASQRNQGPSVPLIRHQNAESCSLSNPPCRRLGSGPWPSAPEICLSL